MDRWDPIALTSTFRPILEPLEVIQTTQDQVGLYDGRLKAEDYPSGTVYLTNYRILYIDAKDPARKSIGLALRLIQGIQHYGGFISSSPKITLDLYPRSTNVDPQSSSDLISSQGQRKPLDTSFAGLSLKSESSWVCGICYNSNQGGIQKCTICGCKKPAPSTDTPTTPAADPFLLNDPIPSKLLYSTSTTNSSNTPTLSGTGTEATGIACPACTFQNDPFMIQCEICGTELQDADSIAFMLDRQQQHQRSISNLPSTIRNSSSTPSLSSTLGQDDAINVKSSGAATKAWESKPKPKPVETHNSYSSDSTSSGTAPSPLIKVGGISSILQKVETNKKVTDETMTTAFQDLQGLMEKAAEMVTLAETISNRLAKSNSVDKEESATFKTYLLSMGIAAPVTKDTAGAVFHKELARELVEFILPIVEREGGTMSLMDIYCVFNRARGVELISPKDLHTACQMFSDLNLPLRLRKFDSGLLVIQTLARYSDDEVSTAVWKRIQALPPGSGLTAVEFASAVQISVALAQEQLLMTEARGRICRDESVEGIRFYDNLFTSWEI
ncbi:hypothetical protein BGZ83_009477 [Gryganskiella cystojenkinii]|nr:hypothetical protein BGZ83_009477 [Gryganskiella cystojenkinii]